MARVSHLPTLNVKFTEIKSKYNGFKYLLEKRFATWVNDESGKLTELNQKQLSQTTELKTSDKGHLKGLSKISHSSSNVCHAS